MKHIITICQLTILLLVFSGNQASAYERLFTFNYQLFSIESYCVGINSVVRAKTAEINSDVNESNLLNQNPNRRQKVKILIQGFFYGLLFMMMFYNLFLYISLHDKSYLYYILYVFFTIIFILHDSGYLQEFGVPASSQILKGFYITKLIAYIFYIMLMRCFISPVNNYQQFDKIVASIQYFLIAIAPINLVLIFLNTALFKIISTIMAYVFVPVFIILLVIMFIKGDKLERYFVFGSILLFSGAGFLLIAILFNTESLTPLYGLQLGIVFQVFLFSIGLSYRYQLISHENVQSKYEVLKTQIDPHFFFNSLSVLTGLVYKDAKLAVKYIAQLSKVYRNVLDKNVESLVTIENELQLLESYIFLIKIRFGENISFNINLSSSSKTNVYIPPNTLQLLIENSIKHNKCSKEEPLLISISENESHIIVKNNLNTRNLNSENAGIGLENIRNRFKLLKGKKIVVNKIRDEFEVILPKYKLKDYASINF